tara:strand:- start:1033 stop:1659 length:627 start_codon:yes stop_codon:yes gene_type:complete
MNFTFCAFDLGIIKKEKEEMLAEILDCPDNFWYYDKFRGCKMLPVFNGGDILNNTSKGRLNFTVVGLKCKTLKDVLTEKVFPFMNPIGRVTILKTDKNTSLNTHLDCKESEIGSLQHKFRIALKGQIDTLYFLDRALQKVYIPKKYDTYVLDGGHPHSLDPGDEEKVTICVGAPWKGSPTKKYKSILQNSLHTMTVTRPENIKEEWKN